MMQLKQFLFLIGLFLFLQSLTAQDEVIEKGVFIGGAVSFFKQNNAYPYSFNIGGVGGLISNNSNDSKNRQVSFSPYLGYEFSNKIAAGFGFDLSFNKYEIEGLSFISAPEGVFYERINNQYGGNLFVRYTVNPENKLNFLLQPYVGLQLGNTEEKHDSNIVSEEKANYFDSGIGIGLLYQISNRWSATLRMGGLNYINGKWELVDRNKEQNFSSFRFNASLSTIYLGFEMKL
jgi:hypothetical protein